MTRAIARASEPCQEQWQEPANQGQTNKESKCNNEQREQAQQLTTRASDKTNNESRRATARASRSKREQANHGESDIKSQRTTERPSEPKQEQVQPLREQAQQRTARASATTNFKSKCNSEQREQAQQRNKDGNNKQQVHQ